MSTSRIRIKMGQIEVEYEGSEAFLKKELHELLEAVSKLYQESGDGDGPQPPSGGSNLGGGTTDNGGKIYGTTETIAGKLKCKVGNGRELLTAAAAHLTFDRATNTFSRQSLHDAAKTASTYYKTSVGKNLSDTIGRMVKGNILVENAKDVYSLSATSKAALEAKLAN